MLITVDNFPPIVIGVLWGGGLAAGCISPLLLGNSCQNTVHTSESVMPMAQSVGACS